MRRRYRLWQFIGSNDSIIGLGGIMIMIFTGCKCQILRHIYAGISIVAMWRDQV